MPTSPTDAHLARGYAIAFLSAGILSLTGLFIRHLTQNYHLPSLVLAFWRAAFSAGTLGLALLILKPGCFRVRRSDLGFLALFGLVLAGFNAVWTVAVALTGAALATVLVNSSAVFAVLLGRLVFKETLTWAKVAAVLLGLAGCALVADAAHPAVWRTEALGLAAGLASGVCYAVYTLMGRAAAKRDLDPWTSVFYTFGLAAPLLLLAALGHGGGLFGLGGSVTGWGWLLLLAAGPTVVGFGLYNASLRYLPSSVANLIVTTEPVFTALLAYQFLGERLRGPQMAGAALILAGVAILRLSERRGMVRVAPPCGAEAFPG